MIDYIALMVTLVLLVGGIGGGIIITIWNIINDRRSR